MMNKHHFRLIAPRLFLLLAAALAVAPTSRASDLKLHYDRPAKQWLEALPVGNGHLAGMVFGGVDEEHLQLNEATLWSGGPRDWDNPGARVALPGVRELVLDGKYYEAHQAAKALQGPYTQAYMPMADLRLNFVDAGRAKNYYRDLDLDTAVATTTFSQGGVNFRRQVFASHPDRVIIIRLTADRPGAISFEASLTSRLKFSSRAAGLDLILSGKAPYHADPNYHRTNNPMPFSDDPVGPGMNFTVICRTLAEGGRVVASDDLLSVFGADAVTIVIAAATSFNGFDREPGRDGRDHAGLAKTMLEAAAEKSFNDLRAAHVADHQALFRRVSLDLGPSPAGAERMNTDRRVDLYHGSDPGLVSLFFQYGRYLLIASSRADSETPANLQGIWNDELFPPWSSNYTININTEMNYWLAEPANLPENVGPLVKFVEELAVNGKRTAAINYGCGGWVAHHNSDLWRQSAPVGNYGQGDPLWAFWPMGGAWLCNNLWDHYAYGRDVSYLRRVYPTMKGAAEFLLDFLVDDGHGRLVTIPSTSPEHYFFAPDGRRGRRNNVPVRSRE